MLSCELCETFKNTYFEEYLQTTVSGGVLQKSPFLKTYNIHKTKVANNKCSVKKLFLVVDIAVKMTRFNIYQYLLQKSITS